MEFDLRAAPVGRRANFLQFRGRMTARIGLAVELAVDGDLDFDEVGQRVDDRDADAVQAAGRLVGLVREFAARVQHRHDDFEGGLVLELRVDADRNAAAIVAHGQIAVLVERRRRSWRRGRRRLRRWRCRALRRRGGDRRARPCRRYTCPGACGRAPGPRGPRCPSRSSRTSPTSRRRTALPGWSWPWVFPNRIRTAKDCEPRC